MSKSNDELPRLDLSRLGTGVTTFSRAHERDKGEACAVCLEHHEHPIPVQLTIDGSYNEKRMLSWFPVTEEMRRAWRDLTDATEEGACGLAFLLILDLTEYTILNRSWKGTGFDYWLDNKDTGLYAGARLEVSGILSGDNSKVNRRVNEKLNQTDVSDNIRIPAYVVVVEFSRPLVKVVLKQ